MILHKGATKVKVGDEWVGIPVGSDGPSIEIDPTLTIEGAAAEAKTVGDELAKKASKVQIDYLGEKVFKHGEDTLNFADIYNYHIVKPDFTFIVYGNRAYLCSFIDVDGNPKQMRFDSTINSDNRTKVSSIYLTSLDGVAINTVSVSDINSENSSNKSQEIDDSQTKYPSNKAVKNYFNGQISTINEKVTASEYRLDNLETALIGVDAAADALMEVIGV